MSTSPRSARVSAALLAAAALVVAPISVLPAAAADPVVEGAVEVDLLTINDFHGRLEAAPPVAGAATLGGMVDSYEAANPNTIFAAAGDLIGASTFTSFIQDDQPTIDALNAIGLDVSAFGNHEFDQGRGDIARIEDEADWPYLAANLYDRAAGVPAFEEYSVVETGGVSIGFVGAVTEELPSLVSPDGIATLEVRPIVPEVNRVAAALSDGDPANGEADVVILLVHEGPATAAYESATDPGSAFGEIVLGASADIDAIVGGHTHLQFDHDVPIPGTDRTRPVLMSGEYGVAYGHTTISVDPDTGELLSISAEVLPLVTTPAFTPDPAVAAIVAEAVAVANQLGSVSLGEVSTDITRGVQSNGTSENRGAESTIGNLIADAQLAATQDLGTQLAIMNPGGIRADLVYAASGANDPAGNVTYREAALVQPFANTLVTFELTGAQLRQVLEEQWQPAGSSRPFLKLGMSAGFEYTYDPAAAAGSRISTMTLDGAPVADAAVIKVVANSFLAAGGDNFVTLAQGANKADSGRIDLTAFVDYLGANTPVTPDLAQRSVGVQVTAPASAEGYLPGEEVTATLSSLLFSRGGPTAGDAAVLLGGETLGSAPVAFAITDAFDEQGSATVTFEIPEGVSGPQSLTITGPGGTAVDVPITVAEPAVEAVGTWALAWPDRFLVRRGSSVDVNVYVRASDGSAPVGTVELYDGRTLVGTVEVTTADGGRIEVPSGALGRGIHVLNLRFTGTAAYEDARTATLVLVY
ncbi:5'-nucleotidase C-terminal domain-containing protein [Pseudolysinimonas sp.]|jgi:5'-nucleotidase|uniref:5'-nucleotidase C-terminal domain-containing protein n=1 Tax=Pseudolysinimonas sp. TaxID=2680009 RepID=UPI003783A054